MSNNEIKALEAKQQALQKQRTDAEALVRDLRQKRATQILNADLTAAEETDAALAKGEREIELLTIASDACFAGLRRARAAAFRAHAEGILTSLAGTQQQLSSLLKKHVNALRSESSGAFDNLRGLPEEFTVAIGMGFPELDRQFLAALDGVLSRAVILAFAGDVAAVDLTPVKDGLRQMIERAVTAEKSALERVREAERKAVEFGQGRDRQRGGSVLAQFA
jgi:hypothetical protein